MNIKLNITSMLVALLFSAGVHAAESAREDVYTSGANHEEERTRGWDAKLSLKDSGPLVTLVTLSQAFPVTNDDYLYVWETAGMSRDVLAMILTGGSILGWGDLQAYRNERLATLSRDPKNEASMAAFRNLSAIKDNAGIRAWAVKDASARAIQIMHMARQNSYASTEVANRTVMRSVEYYDNWRPTVYGYGLLANNVMCALAESVEAVQPDSSKLPAKLMEAYLNLPDSVFNVPELKEVCQKGTYQCQPSSSDNSFIEAKIGERIFRTDSSGITIKEKGSSKFFGEGTVCGREWNFTEDRSKGANVKDSTATGRNTTRGGVVIQRKKAARPKE